MRVAAALLSCASLALAGNIFTRQDTVRIEFQTLNLAGPFEY